MPFPRSSCDSLSFSINIGVSNWHPARQGHIDIEDRFCRETRLLIFETASAFHDYCASELNNTATPPPQPSIKLSCQIVKGVQFPIYLAASLLFSTIVAVVEVEVGRRQVPKVELCQFKE